MQIQTTKKDLGGFIAIAAVTIIVLGIVMVAVGPGTKFANGWQYLTSKNQQSQSTTSASSVVGSPTLSAQQIDTILSNAGSPASGTGQDLYNLGVQYHIDPTFAMAVFFNESNLGKNGEASITHSLGNLRPVPGEDFERDGYAGFNSWQDGYSAFYKLISGPLYAGSGKVTVESIIPIYAPSGDHNDPSHYIGVVESCIRLWRSGSTGVPA